MFIKITQIPTVVYDVHVYGAVLSGTPVACVLWTVVYPFNT